MESLREYSIITLGHIRTSRLRAASWFSTAIITNSLYTTDWLPARNSLPEPIDVKDHIGNVSDSLFYTGIGTLAVSAMLRLSTTPSTVRKTALGAGLAIATLANAVAETKLGQQLFDIQGMGQNGYRPNQDPVDFVYGTAVGTGSAALLIKPESHDFVPDYYR